MNMYRSIFSEKDEAVDIGKGYYVTKIGKDKNGNKCVYVAKGSNKAKAIQTNGNCPTVHSDATKPSWFSDSSDPDVKKGISEIMDYLGVKESFRGRRGYSFNEQKSLRSFGRRSFKESNMFKGDDYYDTMVSDPDSMQEIQLYAENDGDLYRSKFLPIIKNMKTKINSGKYDHSLAPKLWGYYVEDALKKYAKDFGTDWKSLLSPKDRKVLAMKLADIYYDGILSGEY